MNNSWHNGVVDMSFATQSSNPFECLLSKDEMQAWCDPKTNNYNTENCTLLNEIRCQAGRTGSSCNDGTNQFTFGPQPDGNIIQTANIKNGNCVVKNPITDNDINIGPPDSSGKCTRNIFYCNGHGTCDKQGKCTCDDGYTIKASTGTNVCIKSEPKKYKCMQTYDVKNNSLVMGCQATSDSSGTSLEHCTKNCNENLYKNKDLACRPGDDNQAEDYQYCGNCAYFLQNNKCSDEQYGSRQSWDGDLPKITVRQPGVADRNVSIYDGFAPFIYRPPYPCVFGNIFCLPKGLSKNGGQVEYPLPPPTPSVE